MKRASFIKIKIDDHYCLLNRNDFLYGEAEVREDVYYSLLSLQLYDEITYNLRPKDILEIYKRLEKHIERENIVEGEMEICKLDSETGGKSDCV